MARATLQVATMSRDSAMRARAIPGTLSYTLHDLGTWPRRGGLRYAVRLRQSIPSSGWMRAAGAGRPQR
jgi:hypothetical protein